MAIIIGLHERMSGQVY